MLPQWHCDRAGQLPSSLWHKRDSDIGRRAAQPRVEREARRGRCPPRKRRINRMPAMIGGQLLRYPRLPRRSASTHPPTTRRSRDHQEQRSAERPGRVLNLAAGRVASCSAWGHCLICCYIFQVLYHNKYLENRSVSLTRSECSQADLSFWSP